MYNQGVTPQVSELGTKASGDPLQMRGLMHVISTSYKEGMSLDDLKVAVASTIQQRLQQSLQNLDPATAQTVMSFLQNVDSTLVLDNNKIVR